MRAELWLVEGLLADPVIILLELLSKWVVGVKVHDELFEFFRLQLQSLGRFKVFTIDGFSFALLEKIQIASDQLQFVSNFF